MNKFFKSSSTSGFRPWNLAISGLLLLFVLSLVFSNIQAQTSSSRPAFDPTVHDERQNQQRDLFYNGPGSSTNRIDSTTSPNATINDSHSGTPADLTPGHVSTTTSSADATSTSGTTTPSTGSSLSATPSTTPENQTQENAVEPLLPAEEAELPTKSLSLTKALSEALSQNYDIQVKTYDEQAASALVRQAGGAFDPVLNVEGSYENLLLPQNTQDFVATGGTPADLANDDPRIFHEDNGHYKIALDGKLPIGTQYEAKTQLDVLRNTLNETSPLALFTPEWQTFSGLTVTQPFLRGFGTDVNEAEIRVAVINKFVSNYEVQDQILGTISQVRQSYNQLCYLTEELEAKRMDRNLGVQLVQDRRQRLEKGEVSGRDLNHAESALAEVIEDYTKAQNEVINEQTILEGLLSRQIANVDQFIYHTTTPLPIPELHQTADELISIALTHRPKYLEAREKVEAENIKIVYAKNATWPQLDFKSTVGLNGLADGFMQSYHREVQEQGPQWSVGFVFSVPFGNNEAEGKLDEEKARKQQAVVQMAQVELNTCLLVRKLVATIRSNQDRLNAMRVFRQTAENGYNQEQTRLEKGLTTDLDLLKFRRDMSEARARELAALADLNNAFVQLHEVTGSLLGDSVKFSGN